MNLQSLLSIAFYLGQRDIILNTPGFSKDQLDRTTETIRTMPNEAVHGIDQVRRLGEIIQQFAKAVA